MKEFLSSLWTRAMLRGIHYRDRYARFDQLYRLQDPWKMAGESEIFRFEETNRLIRMRVSAIETLLEIGCGEGHQTAKLAELCTTIYAIDVSERAVERAKQRYPSATYGVGDVFGAPVLKSMPRVDLVVACEVLYYMSDVSAVLARMQQLGRSCLVTYINEQHSRLSSSLAQIPNQIRADFVHNHIKWHAVWWPAEPDLQTARPNEFGPSRDLPSKTTSL
jgi:2-polyprenyl-3-methyl-5-hydroxy-6-metoxy-1,4-benzoquinol methylase